MKRVWPLLAIGAAAYLLVLAVTFPAARLVPLLERNVAGLSLHAVSGSVFSGQAAQLVYDGIDFGHLTWRFRPAGLLLGRVEFHLELTDPANPGHADIALTPWGHIHGQDLQLTLSPDRLVNHYSPMAVRTSGVMQLQIDAIRVTDGFPKDLAGSLSWEDAVVLTPIDIVPGDVVMALSSQGNMLAGTLVQGGRLEAAGEIQLFDDGRYRVDLRILPDKDMSDETLATLEMLGQMQSDSTLLFKTSGQL